MPKDQEILHELLEVIHPEIGVSLKGVLVLLSLLHGVDHQAGHFFLHLHEVCHVFQVCLEGVREKPTDEALDLFL
jgi:hypothetical protein